MDYDKGEEWSSIVPYTKVGAMTYRGYWVKLLAETQRSWLDHSGRTLTGWDVKVLESDDPNNYPVGRRLSVDFDHFDKVLWLNENPFKSEAQRRYMWVHHPQIARRWAHGH